ncbi:MAG: helix-turn-helix domain-containing protein [Syntrophomonadaceae bacterium]|nr:helix-turn-helix domain-containing protein [Syntrophomonadaceae bacterium]MDD3897957.1 helix-turn-helix domain-containing protein [Syntrophomonadaceae bacterium]MDD4549426.1 helix-turn-helix domain-containing protein [Syntrophomonadaceae bacterium]
MREPDEYRQQLERLAERYPGKEVLTIQEVCSMLGCHRQTLLADKTFPAKRINNKGKYYIPIVGLARWMMTM